MKDIVRKKKIVQINAKTRINHGVVVTRYETTPNNTTAVSHSSKCAFLPIFRPQLTESTIHHTNTATEHIVISALNNTMLQTWAFEHTNIYNNNTVFPFL